MAHHTSLAEPADARAAVLGHYASEEQQAMVARHRAATRAGIKAKQARERDTRVFIVPSGVGETTSDAISRSGLKKYLEQSRATEAELQRQLTEETIITTRDDLSVRLAKQRGYTQLLMALW